MKWGASTEWSNGSNPLQGIAAKPATADVYQSGGPSLQSAQLYQSISLQN
jgi:hypothetical protein